MSYNFRNKYVKDTEAAEETLILNSCFKTTLPDAVKSTPKQSVTYQRDNTDEFDNPYEKRK